VTDKPSDHRMIGEPYCVWANMPKSKTPDCKRDAGWFEAQIFDAVSAERGGNLITSPPNAVIDIIADAMEAAYQRGRHERRGEETPAREDRVAATEKLIEEELKKKHPYRAHETKLQ
jgi:hypothetical protein